MPYATVDAAALIDAVVVCQTRELMSAYRIVSTYQCWSDQDRSRTRQAVWPRARSRRPPILEKVTWLFMIYMSKPGRYMPGLVWRSRSADKWNECQARSIVRSVGRLCVTVQYREPESRGRTDEMDGRQYVRQSGSDSRQTIDDAKRSAGVGRQCSRVRSTRAVIPVPVTDLVVPVMAVQNTGRSQGTESWHTAEVLGAGGFVLSGRAVSCWAIRNGRSGAA